MAMQFRADEMRGAVHVAEHILEDSSEVRASGDDSGSRPHVAEKLSHNIPRLTLLHSAVATVLNTTTQ